MYFDNRLPCSVFVFALYADNYILLLIGVKFISIFECISSLNECVFPQPIKAVGYWVYPNEIISFRRA